VSVYRWVPRCTPLLIDAARPSRRSCGDRWFVDETYVIPVGAGRSQPWVLCLIFLLSSTEVTTDRAPTYPRVLDELLPPPVTSLSSTRTIRSKQITAG
jgi:transposase, IS6 family